MVRLLRKERAPRVQKAPASSTRRFGVEAQFLFFVAPIERRLQLAIVRKYVCHPIVNTVSCFFRQVSCLS